MPDTTPPPPPPDPYAHLLEPASPNAVTITVAGGPDQAVSTGRNVGNELVATVMVMLAGPGLLVLGPSQISTLAVAVSFGLATALAIGVVGAVANPAFSLALFITRQVSAREMYEDWVGQFAGGIIGGAIVWGINDQTRAVVGANGWGGGGYSGLGSVIAAELVFTIVLVVVFLTTFANGEPPSRVAAYTGAACTIGMLVLLGISGGGMNPARSLGSAIFTDHDPSALGQVIVFIIVPLVAAVAAVFIWLAIDDAEVDDTVFDATVIDRVADRFDGTAD